LTKELAEGELIALASALWETGVFDPMICAIKMLSSRRVRPSQILWERILYFLKRVDGWALEDQLAKAAWKCILADGTLLDELEKWTMHSNFWMRRAALVYTLPFAKRGHDPERMLRWASGYAADPEWFIQKAIGWWLRVLGEHNPERVSLFLSAHWEQLKGVARREATRKLKSEWQQKILGAR
jgi:3-methyladenine DNA glycosylase AlkD